MSSNRVDRRRRLPCGLLIALFLAVAVFGAAAVYWLWQTHRLDIDRSAQVWSFLKNPEAHTDWMVNAGIRCGDAPFIQPTTGFIGFLWGDSFYVGHHHQGIDYFGGADAGVTPVYAAYPGYLTREQDWKSSVIIRVPDDPLHPGRQIWVYYTHMADPGGESYIVADFPPGTAEIPVEAGALLGYQGNYSGTPGNPVGVHLHLSIVKDNGQGGYLNELEKENTFDPSPYLGLPLNAESNAGVAPVCP